MDSLKSISQIAERLNELAVDYDIGQLQEIRKELKEFDRRPGSKIFSSQTIDDKNSYAFHHGGRSELQYNIGFDGSDGEYLRHGVAFSLEPSQTLPDIDILRPNIARFNEYIAQFAQRFPNMRMWHYEYDSGEYVRSEDSFVGQIHSSLITPKTFIFAGWKTQVKETDCDQILADFDRLLPLYRYVQSKQTLPLIEVPNDGKFKFTAGWNHKKASTTAHRSNDPLNVNLRHNELQDKLNQRLCNEYGKDNVGTEHPSGNGMRVDAVVKTGEEYFFYEIKTYSNARACIREAVGQLLEYSYWPGGQNATKLFIVGEPELCSEGEQYLELLKDRFNLPLTYMQLK